MFDFEGTAIVVTCLLSAAPVAAQAPATSHPASPPKSAESTPSEKPVYMGRAFLFEADIDHGIAAGWCPADAPREDLLDAVAETLEARVRRSGKFVEAAVRREEGDRFSVTFVGRQSRGFEDLLKRGLAMAGRLGYRVVAGDEERRGCDEAADPDSSACSGLASLDWWGGQGERRRAGDASPVVVLAEPQHLLHADTVEKFRVVGLADGSVGLEVTLDAAGWDALASFLADVGKHELALTVDDAVVRRGIAPDSLDHVILIQGGLGLNDLRPLTLAFAGEPLRVPLRFVGTAERELPNVKWRDSPTAIE